VCVVDAIRNRATAEDGDHIVGLHSRAEREAGKQHAEQTESLELFHNESPQRTCAIQAVRFGFATAENGSILGPFSAVANDNRFKEASARSCITST
jgi:hypothetical protein